MANLRTRLCPRHGELIVMRLAGASDAGEDLPSYWGGQYVQVTACAWTSA